MVRRSITLLVLQPGQNTSSQGVPASSPARIVGDHSMSAEGELVVPALNDGLRLGARCLVGGIAFEARLHVEPPRPNPHDGPHSLPRCVPGWERKSRRMSSAEQTES
jgi:hypothetical protein